MAALRLILASRRKARWADAPARIPAKYGGQMAGGRLAA
jgi:hypothetical protein